MEGKSPAIYLLDIVWNHAQRGNLKSWIKFNHSLHDALKLAVSSDLKFDVDDFKRINERFSPGYWMGVDGSSGLGEAMYSLAVFSGNISAAKSFEQWKNRKPFMLENSQRIYMGREFSWESLPVVCTSFSGDQSHLTACHYKRRHHIEYPTLINYGEGLLRRFTINHSDLASHRKGLRKLEKESGMQRISGGNDIQEN